MSSIRRASTKRSKKSNYEGPDKFNELPYVIIGYILSFLPIKDAVRTSVLSTEWKYMWTYITKLQFEDRAPNCRNKIHRTQFANFVYRVLLHLNTFRVQHFSLLLSGNYDPYHVNQWISTVFIRGVDEAIIVSKKKLDISSYPILESHLLQKLVMNMYECTMKVPTLVCLSSLVILKLSGISFKFHNSNDPQNLSLRFPILKECDITNCTWSDIKVVTFDVPVLDELLVNQTSSFLIPSESQTILKFRAPCLTKFSYIGRLFREIITQLDLSPTTLIARAHISLFYSGQGSEATTRVLACELLKQLSKNVDRLVFEGTIDFALTQKDVPTFGLLSRLELQVVDADILLTFLQKSPFLRTLILQDLNTFGEAHSNLENMPRCLRSTLKVFKYRNLVAAEHELNATKFVMEQAKVLKKASFSPKWNLRPSIFEKVKKKILTFKRNESLVIEFPPFQRV